MSNDQKEMLFFISVWGLSVLIGRGLEFFFDNTPEGIVDNFSTTSVLLTAGLVMAVIIIGARIPKRNDEQQKKARIPIRKGRLWFYLTANILVMVVCIAIAGFGIAVKAAFYPIFIICCYVALSAFCLAAIKKEFDFIR